MHTLRKHLLLALPALMACLLLAAPAAQAKAPPKLKPKVVKKSEPSTKPIQVNLNSATVEQLMLLPGVGKTKAEAIVKHRKLKKFKTVDDLLQVKGFGAKVIERLRANAILKGRSSRVAKPKPKGPIAPVKAGPKPVTKPLLKK